MMRFFAFLFTLALILTPHHADADEKIINFECHTRHGDTDIYIFNVDKQTLSLLAGRDSIDFPVVINKDDILYEKLLNGSLESLISINRYDLRYLRVDGSKGKITSGKCEMIDRKF
jgi:hypothetical protein